MPTMINSTTVTNDIYSCRTLSNCNAFKEVRMLPLFTHDQYHTNLLDNDTCQRTAIVLHLQILCSNSYFPLVTKKQL